MEAGEMDEWFKGLAALADDQGFIPGRHKVSHKLL